MSELPACLTTLRISNLPAPTITSQFLKNNPLARSNPNQNNLLSNMYIHTCIHTYIHLIGSVSLFPDKYSVIDIFLKIYMSCLLIKVSHSSISFEFRNSFQAKLLTCKSSSGPSVSFFNAGHPKKTGKK